MKSKINILKTTLAVLIGALLFYITYLLFIKVFEYLFSSLAGVPLMNVVINFLSSIRWGGIIISIYIFALLLAWKICRVIVNKITMGSPKSHSVSVVIIGVLIILYYGSSFFMHFNIQVPYTIAILNILAGILMISFSDR